MRRAVWVLGLGLAGCAPPDLSAAFNQLELYVDATPADADDRFAGFVAGARSSLHVALPTDDRGVIAEAIVDRWTHGVDVEVITDVDAAGAPGIALLAEAGVPLTLADGGLEYFDFNINDPVRFSSENTVMSDAWAVVDRRRALVGTRAGAAATGETVFVELSGEEIIEDLLSEHRQIFGGTDATATTAFDGLAKSRADARWRYPTQTDVDLELWFGPQERLVKRLIDAIYMARGSVHVLTNDLTDAGFARALQDKARRGFSVHAVVGPAYDRGHSRPAAVFENETPDVDKGRYTGADDVPTLVLIDHERGIDGRIYDRRAFLVTHDVYTTSRIEAAEPPQPGSGEPYIGPVTDQLVDGTLVVLRDYDGENAPEIEALYDLWKRHADAAGSL